MPHCPLKSCKIRLGKPSSVSVVGQWSLKLFAKRSVERDMPHFTCCSKKCKKDGGERDGRTTVLPCTPLYTTTSSFIRSRSSPELCTFLKYAFVLATSITLLLFAQNVPQPLFNIGSSNNNLLWTLSPLSEETSHFVISFQKCLCCC